MECCRGRYAEAERQFGPAIASRDLDRYHRKGPDATSRLLLEALSDQVRRGDSLLDIGSGVGVLDFELLSNGVQTATLVDASPAYLHAAGDEAAARSLSDRGASRCGRLHQAGRQPCVRRRCDAASSGLLLPRPRVAASSGDGTRASSAGVLVSPRSLVYPLMAGARECAPTLLWKSIPHV